MICGQFGNTNYFQPSVKIAVEATSLLAKSWDMLSKGETGYSLYMRFAIADILQRTYPGITFPNRYAPKVTSW